MKQALLLAILFLASTVLWSQKMKSESWTIRWNKKTIFQAKKEDEKANTVKIRSSELAKSCFLEISYQESDLKNTWIRSILLFDDSNHELWRKDSTRNVRLAAADLKKILGDKKTIRVYTIVIPSDPDLAARVRVRRVHLCTIEFQ